MNTSATALWQDSLPPHLRAPVGAPLPGDTTTDVAILGGGLTGLWTAYYLTRADPALRVTVIEAREAGFGASGRNGGWASALLPMTPRQIAERHGRDAAVRMVRAMQATVDEIGRVAGAEGWDVDWHKGGSIMLARSAAQWQTARDDVAAGHRVGLTDADLCLLGADETASRVSATDVVGGTFTPHCARVHPARLVRALAHSVAASGVDVHEHTRALRIEPRSDLRGPCVRTEHGDVRAEVVVVATEGYSGGLAGTPARAVPVYSLMLATEPLDESTWDGIGLRGRETFGDLRHVIVYGQRTGDDRLAFGGRGAPYHFGSRTRDSYDSDPSVHALIHEALVDMFPALRDTTITHRWGGALGVARDWWASCGLDRRTGLAWAGGYAGDGVSTTNLAGRTLADLITGRDSPVVHLPWVGHRSPRWEPEPLRWLGINAALRLMRAADRREDRTGRHSLLARVVERI